MPESHCLRRLLLDSFQIAVSTADPLYVLPAHLPTPPKGRTLVIGAGKAAARMAQAVEAHFSGPLAGLVVTRYGHALPTHTLEVLEAGHPVPDAAGERAAAAMLAQASSLTADDLLLVLISGGGSSLWPLPLPGVTLADIQVVTRALLRSGARIEEVNTVRKHLSAIQGGRLAASTAARVCTLIISDVTGNDPTHIASGPCAPDPTSFADALTVIEQYRVAAPVNVLRTLVRGIRGEIPDTSKPRDPCFARVSNRIIASGDNSLEAAASYFNSQGYRVINLGEGTTGEARVVAKQQAARIRELRAQGLKRLALLSGGETTVTVHSHGRGGRNSEFLLALAHELGDLSGIHALACGTDGIDGTENNAGAMITPATLQRARELGLDINTLLANNDSYRFFAALDDLVITGPTYTNVNDYRVILLN